MQQVAIEGGVGNWDFTGWVPDRYEKVGDYYTVVFKKGTGDKREEASIGFPLDGNKTLTAAFAELNAADFDIQKFEEADVPDFAGLGLAEFGANDSALLAKFNAADFENLLTSELGGAILDYVEPLNFKTRTLADGTKRHTAVLQIGDAQDDIVEVIVNEDAAGTFQIIDAQDFRVDQNK